MPNIHWEKLINAEYWLEGLIGGVGTSSITPPNEYKGFFFWMWLGLFSFFIIIGIILHLTRSILLHPEHPLKSKLPFLANNLIWMGILGVVWFLFRQVKISTFGARIWLLIGLGWFIFIKTICLNYLFKRYPLEIQFFKKTYKNL